MQQHQLSKAFPAMTEAEFCALQSIALNIRENQKSAAKLSHQELTANIAAKNALD
jgi:hypothetical protein